MFPILLGIYLGMELLDRVLLYTFQWNNVSIMYSWTGNNPQSFMN